MESIVIESIINETVLLLLAYYLFLFIVGTVIKNNSIVDIGWGIGFVIVAWFSTIRNGLFPLPGMLITICISIWGIRLFYHIIKRNWGKPEDFRYANWRKEWGRYAVFRAFFQVYFLQGLLLFVIALPVILVNNSYYPEINAFGLIGLFIWLVGFMFESIGDLQLKNFISKPENKGKIMKYGLWKYTRHPNYFGEASMWWGLAIIAFSSGVTYYVFASPITITFLLLFVSGVPLLEKSMADIPGYDEYKEATPIFFPWFPKK